MSTEVLVVQHDDPITAQSKMAIQTGEQLCCYDYACRFLLHQLQIFHPYLCSTRNIPILKYFALPCGIVVLFLFFFSILVIWGRFMMISLLSSA